MVLLRKLIGLYGTLIITVSATSLTLIGQTVRLGNTTFYVPGLPTSIINIDLPSNDTTCKRIRDLIPLTVVNNFTSNFSIPAFESFISGFLTSDDVFQLDFLQTIFFNGAIITAGIFTSRYGTHSVRLGVKDLFDIAGVKTGCSNREYYELYGTANGTATAVRKLVDAGAIVIGKLKTSQFANGEYATADWVDYLAPFNARGDGYQDPGSSSAGPGAAIGAYPWLDLALGTDTGGSIRIPADSNGVYGNRPSHGMVALDFTMPLSPDMDTAGVLTRDPSLLREAGYVLYGPLESVDAFPKKLFTVGFPVNISNDADKLLIGFANALGKLLGTTPEALDVEETWRSAGPAVAQGSSLDEHLGQVFPILTSKQQFALVAEKFFADYGLAHDGRRPFVDPSPLLRWEYGQAIPACAVDKSLANMTTFGQWWRSTIQTADNSTCSNSVLIYIGSDGETGIDRVPSFAGTPDIVVPIGQVVYNSTITLHDEYLPVTVDIMAAKGCDGMLYELISRLREDGTLPEVHPGPTL